MRRFLGPAVPARGPVPHRGRHEVSSHRKERREGRRLQQGLPGHARQRYDQGAVRRLESLMRAPADVQV